MTCNGIITTHKIDTNVFKVGNVFEFHIDPNVFICGILKKVDIDHNEMTFLTLEGSIIVRLQDEYFYIVQTHDKGAKYMKAHFRKMAPSYEKKTILIGFNCEGVFP